MVDEPFFAYTLCNLNDLIKELDEEKKITQEDKTHFMKTYNRLMEIAGLTDVV